MRLADALEGAERKAPPSAIAAIRLLILTGCRLSEILSLQWEWIDFEPGCVVLPGHLEVIAPQYPQS